MKRTGLIALSGLPLGDAVHWNQWYASPDEVYLWRARLGGAKLTEPSDALAVVRAFGLGSDTSLDVRGIAVRPGASGTDVDVVLTTDRYRAYPPGIYDDAADLALKVASDAALRQRFPQLSVSEPELLQLTAPADAVDFWRAHGVLWSTLLGQEGHGGPTNDFAEARGVYRGAADDGPRLAPWTEPQPGLGPGASAVSQNYTALWVVGGLVLALLLVRTL